MKHTIRIHNVEDEDFENLKKAAKNNGFRKVNHFVFWSAMQNTKKKDKQVDINF